MRVGILDDWCDTLRTLDCFAKLAGHDVVSFTDHATDTATLAARLRDCDAIVLIRERTPITGELLGRLPNLRLISQRSRVPAHRRRRVHRARCRRLLGPALELAFVRHRRAHVGAGARRRPPLAPASCRAPSGVMADARRAVAAVQDARHLRLRADRQGGRRLRTGVRDAGRRLGARRVARARPQPTAGRSPTAATRSSPRATSSRCTCASSRRRGASSPSPTLRWMRPTALLVNTSRAGLIEPGALAAALDAGRRAAPPWTSTSTSRSWSPASRSSGDRTSSARRTSATSPPTSGRSSSRRSSTRSTRSPRGRPRTSSTPTLWQ